MYRILRLAIPVMCLSAVCIQTAFAVTLEQLFSSIERHYPLVQAAREEVGRQEARILERQGAFDPAINGSFSSRLGGYYDGQYLQGTVSQPLYSWGSELWAGYRISDGDFPVYDTRSQTLGSGEFQAGLRVSLLRDREIDERRAGLWSSSLDLKSSQLELEARQVAIYQDAYVTYVRWLVTGRLLQTYTTLLDVAVDRRTAIASTVEAGGLPDILLVENDQSILQRRALVIDATRELELAAQALSLYNRDISGNPLVPEFDFAIPLPREPGTIYQQDFDLLLSQALSRRPDISGIGIDREKVSIDMALTENAARPELDLNIYASRDMGTGPAALAGTDNVVGLSFNIPLRNRSAAGRIEAGRHELQALSQELRYLKDRTRADMSRALLNLETTRTMEALAIEEMDLATRLAEAEARRFEEGLSDYFLLNARERSLAEAQLRRWQATLNHHMALAGYFATSMDDSVFSQDIPLESD